MKMLLSKNVTVADYLRMESSRDSNSIVRFLRDRFTERYVTPMRVDPKLKNGFTIMAVSCLMIEAVESFYQGWPDSQNKSKLAFCYFFDRNHNFSFIRGYSHEFYLHIRCGILHQAETTGGWRIRRDGRVFQEDTKTINAKLFHDQVEKALNSYCNDLAGAAWDSTLWGNFRKKMKAVCENCKNKES